MRSLKVWRDFEPETYAAGLPALLDAYDSIWLMHWSEEDRSAFDWLDRLGFVNTARLITEHYTAVNITTDLTVFRYDRPPQGMVAGYDNGMTLRQTAIYPDDLRVDLWWSADAPLTESYTTSVFLLDAGGRLVAQADSIPFDGGRPTPTWQTGEIIFESKRLALVDGFSILPPGRYAVGVQVYRWTPEGTERSLTLDGEEWTIVGAIVRQAKSLPVASVR